MLSVSELCIYPIKGGRGLSVPEAQVERRGLTADRRWMLIDDEGRFLSQRGHPKLALLTVTRTAHGLRVHAPGRSPLDIATPGADAARRPVVIWDDVVDAPLASEAAQAWFSAWLEQSVQLCHMDTKAHRPVDPDYALRPDDSVSFADGYPLLLTSEASLGELNTRIEAGPVPTPVPMDRFRPNVVIAGSEQPFEEDTWLEVQMGDVLFTIVKPCARCVVTTIDQQTGVQGKEPLRTLNTFRRAGRKVLFGMNLIPSRAGTLRVGDPVTVKRRRVRG